MMGKGRGFTMLPIISLAVLALAVSLDGFGVGAMYGLRQIRIPLLSIVIISICSGLIIMASMYIGVLLLQVLHPDYAKALGAIILIGIGCWAVIQTLLPKNRDEGNQAEPSEQTKVLQILRSPSKADADQSGNISSSEATFLGIALSLDAFGAGIGAALIGFKPLITSTVIAISAGTFITLGLKIGYLFSHMSRIRELTVIPGCILILMGMMKLL
jgi:putative sporulation protein YtaF